MLFPRTRYLHWSNERSCILGLFILISSDGAGAAETSTDPICDAGQSQPCLCPSNDFGAQFCLPDSSGWTECSPCLWYDEWCDDDTGLCWQDPPKDYNVKDKHGGVTQADAVRYCDELAFGGHGNWRLPTLDELRTLIRDAGITELTCPLRAGSSVEDMSMLDVILCSGRLNSFECDGSGGCCWNENLSGTCDTIDPASTTHYLEYWSSTPAADDPENWFGFVFFDTGTVGFNHALSFGEVRCVRDNNNNNNNRRRRGTEVEVHQPAGHSNNNDASPRVTEASSRQATNDDDICEAPKTSCITGETRECTCSTGRSGMLAVMSEGVQKCVVQKIPTTNNGGSVNNNNNSNQCFGHCQCSSFLESPDPIDVCSQCDQVTVTVRVPNRLRQQPYMLAVFLYKYDTIDFRPPDVGVQENEIRYPDIDVDKPITMTMPGCSYYRDRCMEGEYYLSVYIKMNEGRFPGVPEPFSDMVYADGRNEDPVVLGSKQPITGSNQQQQYELDVTVEPFIMSMFP